VCSALNERVPPVCAAGRTLPIENAGEIAWTTKG
jgi:hypothetical protein